MSGVSNYAIAVILCFQTLFGCLCSSINQYIYASYLQTYTNTTNGTVNSTTTNTHRLVYVLNVMNDQRDQCPHGDIPFDRDAQAWAQQRSAELFFRMNLMGSCPVIVMTYILGVYTPQLGKRFVLIVPMIGMACQMSIWLAIIYLHLPELWWYISAFIVGLSGSNGVLSLTLNLIITENTLESERSSRFVRFVAMQTALSSITTFGIGYYIHWRGFIDLYWLALLSQLFSIVIVGLFFKSADANLNERVPLLSSSSSSNADLQEFSSTTCSHLLGVCTVFRSDHRSKKKTISLFLTLFANVFYMLAAASFAPFLWFLLNVPFCWTSKDIGNYSALGAVISAILSLFGMLVLTRAGASDAVICIISHIFFCAACLWNAFARYGWQLYVGLLIGAFSGYQGSLTTSMISKWLKPHERNSAFTFLTEINTIVAAFGYAFFNWFYARTVVNYRNLTLLVAAGISIIPFILNSCLFLISRRMSDEEVSLISQADTEPVPFRVDSHLPPHAGDVTCMIIPSRSLTSSLHTPPTARSRMNSDNDHATKGTAGSLLNNVNIL